MGETPFPPYHPDPDCPLCGGVGSACGDDTCCPCRCVLTADATVPSHRPATEGTPPMTTTRYTADAVVLAPHSGGMYVLLIRRAADHDTEPGRLALPGGHVDATESAETAAYRELREETGLDLHAIGATLLRVGRFDEPGRDPRGHYVTDAHVTVLSGVQRVVGQDDADEAVWLPVAEALDAGLAFDHRRILLAAMRRIGITPDLLGAR